MGLLKALIYLIIFCSFSGNAICQNKTDSLIQLLQNSAIEKKAQLSNKIAIRYLKQNPQKAIDYAYKAINYAKESNQLKEEVIGYLNLGSGYLQSKNSVKAFDYFWKALDLCKKNNIKPETGLVYSEIGDAYKNLSEYTKAIEFYNYSIIIFKELKDTSRWARVLHQIAGVYDDLGNYEAGLDYYKKSLELKKKIGDRKGVANSYTNIGIIYKDIGNYANALDYQLKALTIYEDIGNENDVALSYMNIGIIYKNLDDYKKSLSYSTKALEMFKRSGNNKMIARTLNNIGNIYLKLDDYFKAEEYLSKAISSFIGLNDQKMIAKCMNNIGNLKLRVGEKDSALYYYLKAKEIHDEVDDKQGLAIIYQNMGNIYIGKSDLDKALGYVQKSLSIAEEIGIKEIMKDDFLYLNEIYESKGDYKKANYFLKKHETIKDSIYNVEIAKSLSDLQYKFDIEKKNKENEALKKENESRNKIALQFILLTILSVILLILLFSRYIFRRKTFRLISEKNKDLEVINERLTESEKHLKELNATKDKFFSIIAHDLINPFNAFMETTKFLYENYNKISVNEIKELLGDITDSAKNLHTLLENLLQWSRTQTGKIVFNPDNVNIKYIIDNIFYLLKLNAEKKKISLEYSVEENTIVYADPFMLTTIMRNLISNALKFTNEGGKIKVISRENHNYIEIDVTDNGVGISPDYIDKLFRVDIQLSTLGTKQEQGTGLGLVLCKEFVERNGGKINVESEPGKGSTFKFTLPKQKPINFE
ncbi:MAG: tetratricopeptide repeat-containing sensor histidine kinase [Ignavibacteriae bacterium]|nr:tetratricopeptide repeat-containing sensor histidine kinase [Ignavibacteriota bacterium]